MDRRALLASGVAFAATPVFAQQTGGDLPPPGAQPPTPAYPARDGKQQKADTYTRDEIVNSVSDFLGVTAESAGAAIERIFKENGRPTGYVAGEEASGAFSFGLRYGRGLLYMKHQDKPLETLRQRPSIGIHTRDQMPR